VAVEYKRRLDVAFQLALEMRGDIMPCSAPLAVELADTDSQVRSDLFVQFAAEIAPQQNSLVAFCALSQHRIVGHLLDKRGDGVPDLTERIFRALRAADTLGGEQAAHKIVAAKSARVIEMPQQMPHRVLDGSSPAARRRLLHTTSLAHARPHCV
jgi:hypothetical protein